jgi:RNA polymerase sigma-70 factor (ECF subfamily)
LTRENRPETAGAERNLSPQELDRFTECVLPYLDAAHNLARYLLRDPHEAEDAVQEAFLRAIRHFDGFRGVDGRAWLLSIVRNTCFTQLRRRRPGGEKVEFDEEIHSPQEEGSGPEADLTSATSAESVREGLNQLAVEYREVLVLRELEGLSYKEIAHVAGVPIGTVMSRLARGRKQLLIALGTGAKENN